MSMLQQFELYAGYNALMNRRIFDAAARLGEDNLVGDRGAFFKSVLGTLNHILVGDVIWLQRFLSHPPSAPALVYVDGLERPARLDLILFGDLERLRTEREKIDTILVDWIGRLSAADLDDGLEYRNMAGQKFKKQVASLISHLFLHQVHHRGQATTLISQSGIDFGDTDLLEIIDDFAA